MKQATRVAVTMLRVTSALLVVFGAMGASAADGVSLQALENCVRSKSAQVAPCIKQQGVRNADVCRTSALMDVMECQSRFDPAKTFMTDPRRKRVLIEACMRLHNRGTGLSAREECERTFPGPAN